MGELYDEPKIEPWMDSDQISLRSNARSYLQTALDLGLLPASHILEAKVFSQGVSSAVFRVSTGEGYFVVKMRNTPGVLESESLFFQEWAKYGVRTPKVLDTFTASEKLPVSMLVMEYIDALVLAEVMKTPELTQHGYALEMGRILARMHKAKGQGFGIPRHGDEKRGVFNTFSEQIENTLFKSRINELLNGKHIGDQEVILAKQSVKAMEKELAAGETPSLLHYDLIPPHIFKTQPLTVFDPVGLISHPAFCLSMTIFRMRQYMFDHLDEDCPEMIGEIIKGYREVGKVSSEAIASGVILNALMVMSSINRRDQPDKEERLGKLKGLVDQYGREIHM